MIARDDLEARAADLAQDLVDDDRLYGSIEADAAKPARPTRSKQRSSAPKPGPRARAVPGSSTPDRPVLANARAAEAAAAVRALLTEPPAVLPAKEGDPVLPLQIGIREALEPHLRPDATPEALGCALRAYVRATSYLMALARQCATRHDLGGAVVEPVSADNRRWALVLLNARRERRAAMPDGAPAPRSS
jgi:ProQ/FINO family